MTDSACDQLILHMTYYYSLIFKNYSITHDQTPTLFILY